MMTEKRWAYLCFWLGFIVPPLCFIDFGFLAAAEVFSAAVERLRIVAVVFLLPYLLLTLPYALWRGASVIGAVTAAVLMLCVYGYWVFYAAHSGLVLMFYLAGSLPAFLFSLLLLLWLKCTSSGKHWAMGKKRAFFTAMALSLLGQTVFFVFSIAMSN